MKLAPFFTTVLRMAVGWHFLYEGISKLTADDWSAAGYLADSTGFMAGFYHWLASSPELMKVVDPLNIYGLIADRPGPVPRRAGPPRGRPPGRCC